ncbi:MAG: FAD-dependent oxidoreductase [Gammaproteobacteria bacterium]|jgi:2-octaprenyl-6-methoxyphenol hydroxylase|nr:FAD-dependent oxidoreductase [Gammaproteobacteria bacterium]
MRDIAIIGGGLVGLCAALALQHPARRITIIEAGNFDPQPARGLAARSLALSFSSVQIFRALGLWQAIEAQAAPIRHIHVSARARWGVTRLHADDYRLDALGYVIENQALSDCLLQAVQASELIELQQNASFASIDQDALVNIGYRQQNRRRQLKVRLALVADGAQSQARQALGIDHRRIDYGQSVVISNVEVDMPQADTAYERFTAQGPLAMLPLGGRRYACVWTLQPDRAAEVCGLDDVGFAAALQDSFGFRLGLIEAVSARFSLPLQRTSAVALQAGRCLLIGNAANALHPVAGQSFNLALRDVAGLYELLCDQSLAELDAGGIAPLAEKYERQRIAEQRQVIRYGDGLVSMFSNELPLLDQARAAALGLLDLLPALKAQAALSGMGMTFGGNRLLRGHL